MVSSIFKDITIGQYFAGNSIIHRLDARVKIAATFILLIVAFMAQNFYSLAAFAGFVIFLMIISTINPLIYLKTIKRLWPIILFSAILNTIYQTGDVVFSWWIFEITEQGIYRAVFMATRIILLVTVSGMLTYTTTSTSLTDGIERLLRPLRFIGLGELVHVMAMMMTLALRFIPTLVEECQRILAAQMARGANVDTGGVFKRMKALVPILVPLLVASFKRAIELADAMECRCYTGGKGRTRLNNPKYKTRDLIAFLMIAMLIVAVIWLNWRFERVF